jgi:hypothetical protein
MYSEIQSTAKKIKIILIIIILLQIVTNSVLTGAADILLGYTKVCFISYVYHNFNIFLNRQF